MYLPVTAAATVVRDGALASLSAATQSCVAAERLAATLQPTGASDRCQAVTEAPALVTAAESALLAWRSAQTRLEAAADDEAKARADVLVSSPAAERVGALQGRETWGVATRLEVGAVCGLLVCALGWFLWIWWTADVEKRGTA